VIRYAALLQYAAIAERDLQEVVALTKSQYLEWLLFRHGVTHRNLRTNDEITFGVGISIAFWKYLVNTLLCPRFALISVCNVINVPGSRNDGYEAERSPDV
jgi:hypothetical protein